MATGDQLPRRSIIVARVALVIAVVILAGIALALFESDRGRVGSRVPLLTHGRFYEPYDPFPQPSKQILNYERKVNHALERSRYWSIPIRTSYPEGLQIRLHGKDILNEAGTGLNRTGLVIIRRIGRAIATESCNISVETDVESASRVAKPEEWVQAASFSARVAEVLAMSGRIADSRLEVKSTWSYSARHWGPGQTINWKDRDTVIWIRECPPEFHWAPLPPSPPPGLNHGSPLDEYTWWNLGKY